MFFSRLVELSLQVESYLICCIHLFFLFPTYHSVFEQLIWEQQMNFTFIYCSKFDGLTYMIVEGG